jgi:HPt (histidine-containing phosphotransfer) domain-containing protein
MLHLAAAGPPSSSGTSAVIKKQPGNGPTGQDALLVNSISVRRPPAQAGEGHPVGAVVDWDHLARQTMQDEALAREILGMFMDQSQDLLRALREARSAVDRADAAHTLKGSARAVGAFAVADAAAAVEMLPADAPDGPLLDAVARLHAAVAEARSAIAARLPGAAGPGL